MSEKERKLLETICTAVPKMSDFDKGYFLGKAEGIVDNQKGEKKNGSNDDSGDRNSD